MSLNRVTLPSPGREKGQLLVAGLFARTELDLYGRLARSRRAALHAIRAARWKAGAESWLGLRAPGATSSVDELQLRGLGPAAKFDRRALRNYLDGALSAAARAGASRLVLVIPDHPTTRGRESADEILRRLMLAGYAFHRFTKGRSRPRPSSVQLLVCAEMESAYRTALPQARATAVGVSLARDLGNTPPNVAHPAWMADEAEALARSHGLRSTRLGPAELADKGMHAILAVGQGSSQPPQLVRLELGEGSPVISLVGKGVTFDTGGISIKPSAAMDEMKYDKCGACTVLGVMRALAERPPSCTVRAYLPLAENMPDGKAYRPGDIVETYSGKTVEIKNTDAEGRMILADALAWAAEEGPDHLIELSTLTGACVVALGDAAAGLYTPSDGLADDLLRAADESGEGLWRMPLWDEFRRMMKGTHADLHNSAGRWGAANSAAAFLWSFVPGVESFAHIDIAGTAWVGADQKGPTGATGYGVASLCSWIRHAAGEPG